MFERRISRARDRLTASPDQTTGKIADVTKIAITALPPDRNIVGSEEITYYNNSPDTIRTPVIRLFLNIHKPGAPRAGGARAAYLTSGVNIDSFAVNGHSTQWPGTENTGTVQRVPLSTPLLPHDSLHLSFKWHYEISVRSGREGMLDSTTYFLAYFYPRVAVYDDSTAGTR